MGGKAWAVSLLGALLLLAPATGVHAFIGTVYGQVVNMYTGEGIAGVEVRSMPGTESPTAGQVMSFENGVYSMDLLSGDGYTLKFYREGYKDLLVTGIDLPAQSFWYLPVELEPTTGGYLSGAPEEVVLPQGGAVSLKIHGIGLPRIEDTACRPASRGIGVERVGGQFSPATREIVLRAEADAEVDMEHRCWIRFGEPVLNVIPAELYDEDERWAGYPNRGRADWVPLPTRMRVVESLDLGRAKSSRPRVDTHRPLPDQLSPDKRYGQVPFRKKAPMPEREARRIALERRDRSAGPKSLAPASRSASPLPGKPLPRENTRQALGGGVPRTASIPFGKVREAAEPAGGLRTGQGADPLPRLPETGADAGGSAPPERRRLALGPKSSAEGSAARGKSPTEEAEVRQSAPRFPGKRTRELPGGSEDGGNGTPPPTRGVPGAGEGSRRGRSLPAPPVGDAGLASTRPGQVPTREAVPEAPARRTARPEPGVTALSNRALAARRSFEGVLADLSRIKEVQSFAGGEAGRLEAALARGVPGLSAFPGALYHEALSSTANPSPVVPRDRASPAGRAGGGIPVSRDKTSSANEREVRSALEAYHRQVVSTLGSIEAHLGTLADHARQQALPDEFSSWRESMGATARAKRSPHRTPTAVPRRRRSPDPGKYPAYLMALLEAAVEYVLQQAERSQEAQAEIARAEASTEECLARAARAWDACKCQTIASVARILQLECRESLPDRLCPSGSATRALSCSACGDDFRNCAQVLNCNTEYLAGALACL